MANEETFWNGEPTPCRRVIVRVGPCEKPSLWHNGLEGTERRAVEVHYGGDVFLIDDDEGEGQPVYDERQRQLLASVGERPSFKAGDGWKKVTLGEGAPFGPFTRHRSLPSDSVVIAEVSDG